MAVNQVLDGNLTVLGSYTTSTPTGKMVGIMPTADATVRVASQATSNSYGITYYGGNGLWVFNTALNKWEIGRVKGDGQVVNITSCTIDGNSNSSLSASTLYYIYAKRTTAAFGFIEIDHSRTTPVSGDPFGALTVTGFQYKNDGTRNQRLIGAVMPDAGGNVWLAGSRGVYFSGIASYYQRQLLNYQIKFSAQVFTNTSSYQEANSTNYIAAFLWGDGAEPSCQLSGNVQSNTAGAVVSVGVSIDAESPPYDTQDIFCAVANQPYPYCINVSSGDYADTNHSFRVYAKTNTASSASVSGTLTLNLMQ